MSTFLIIGQSFHGLRDNLIAQGHDFVILRDKAKVKHPEKLQKNSKICDFTSVKQMLADVDKAVKAQKVEAVLAMYENYIVPAARIAEHLGLPGLPVESAKACTDKFTMRQLFTKAPVKISPDYALVNNRTDLEEFAQKHDFPLILKPANLAKSLLVTKSHNSEELLKNYDQTVKNIDKIYQRYAPNRQPKLLIEEFLQGSIHSVDAFVDTNGKAHVLDQVVDYQTGYDIGFDDNFHYSRILPSKLSNNQLAAIHQAAEVGCKALGMKNSAAHIEIILTPQGPMIVEIGARNGGYRDRMHMLSNGIDMYENQFRVALGQQPDITAASNEPSAVLELFPKNPGIFQGISEVEKLQKLPSLVYQNVKAKPGDFVGKAADGHKMCAVVMLFNKDYQQFQADLDFVNNHVRVLTKS